MPNFSFLNSVRLRFFISLFLGLFLSFSAFSTRLYVASGGLGSDVSGGGGKFNPLATVGFAIAEAANGDSIIVESGFYSETSIIVNKQVRIFGNESGGAPGTGPKPVFNGPGTVANEAVFVLQANNIEIRNIEIRVNQELVMMGIFAAAGGFNGALIADNKIVSTNTTAATVFSSYGIILGQNSSPAGADSSLIIRNVIEPASGAISFGRGIRLNGGFSTVGGEDIDDANTITGTYGIQYGSASGGVVRIINNTIFGSSAGIEFNNPTFAGNHIIRGNSISPIAGRSAFSMVEIKNHNKAGSTLTLEGNTFSGYPGIGIFSSKSSNVFIKNNNFTPADTARNFASIVVNTKQQTTSQSELASASSVSITGNNFQSAGGFGGTAIAFQNHFSGVNPPFQNVVVGGDGALANTFGLLHARFCELDALSGPSNTFPLWSPANYKVTQMLPVEADFDFSKNKFDLGTGPKLPAQFTDAELMALEDRIQHQIDFDSLGFVTIIPNRAFATSGSVVPGRTSTPSINRALDVVNSDDWTITVANAEFAESIEISNSVKINTEPDGGFAVSSLTMNGAGKTLTLDNDLKVNSGLTLTEGKILLEAASLRMGASATLTGGSATSFVQTNGNGQVIREGLASSAFAYPIGTSTAYTPTSIANSGTADDIGLRIQNDVLAGGLTGTPVDSVVGVTWVINEGTAGGSSLSVTPQWPGSSEKAGFNRSSTFFQGFAGGSWITLSGAAGIAASGSDPFSAAYNNIAGDLVNLPLRISSSGSTPVTSDSKLYYVSAAGGDDSRSAEEAKNPSTPWLTIGKALSTLDNGDSVQVLSGTYNEANLTFTKSIHLLGNVTGVGSGAGAGTGVKPVVNGISSTGERAIFVLRSPGTEIRNFEIRVDQDSIQFGIKGPQSGFSGAVIADNLILSTKTGVQSVFATYGIILGQTTSNAASDSSLIIRNTVGPASGAALFGRAIRLNGGSTVIGGANTSDANTLTGDYGIQFGSPRGKASLILNNTISAISAGVEFNNPVIGGTHRIAGNKISPVAGRNALAMIEVKNHNLATSTLEIENNEFSGYMIYGVFSTKSKNVVVKNNIFTPADTARNFASIAVNTKQQTSSQTEQPSFSSITITGNDFKAGTAEGGSAISFQNHFSGVTPPFQNVVIGGAGALANKFAQNHARMIELDARSGASNTLQIWSPASYRVTQMVPAEADFDASQNLFNLGSGDKLPADLTEAERMELEDKIQHQIDFDSLGFVTVIPEKLFVTENSFIAPKTSEPSLNRALSLLNSDNWTLTSSPLSYAENILLSNSLTLASEPSGEISLNELALNGAGKTLSLQSDVLINNNLSLVAGKIDLGNSDLSLAPTATADAGSAESYIITGGDGHVVRKGLSSAFTYPIGTATAFAPTQITNTGTADDVSLRVQNDVLSSGLTGIPVDSVVGITWVINESTAGGSTLNVTPQWPGSSEKTGFNRTATFFQAYDGSNWTTISGASAISASGNDPYSAAYSGISGNLVNLPLRISSSDTPPPAAGNLYYVSDQIGDDNRSAEDAKNPATPWKTITKAVTSVANGDSVQVLFGTYNESNIPVNIAVNLFGNVPGIGVGPGAGTGVRPVVNGSASGTDSALFVINSDDVLMRHFQLEVNQESVVQGILSKSGQYNNLRVLDSRIFSAGTGTTPCVRFNTYGMRLLGGGTDSVIVKGTNIEPKDFNLNCAFGRGIRALSGGRMLIGGLADADTNRIVGLYGVQLGDLGGSSVIQNNTFFGQGVEITAPAANSGTHHVKNNRIFAVLPSFFTTLVEFKDIQNDGTGVLMEGNLVSGHANLGLFVGRSRNVSVRNNIFAPSAAAGDTTFTHIYVNTKQATRATVQEPAFNEIVIQGNELRSKTGISGTALVFANHNDDPAADNAFGNVTLGGADALANKFGENLKSYLKLDQNEGPSNLVSPWQTLPVTTMAPVSDDFNLSDNQFSLGATLKRPQDMTTDELFILEDRIQHGIDYSLLGFVTVTPNAAFVSNTSFLAPNTTSPSLKRAVDIAQEGWTINIQPASIDEVVAVAKSMTWNTHPADSMVLGGISMNGQTATLTLTDNFQLADSLVLNNADGGKISIGANNLTALSGAIVTQGGDNSFVQTDGAGSLVIRNLQDDARIFPVGTAAGYAPVTIDDAVATGDNFSVKVAPAATSADFTPALPATTGTFVKFQWTICEAVAGGSNASLNFDWRDGLNVSGTGTLNSVIRHDGTNWTGNAATTTGQNATTTGISSFCAPFAVVESSTIAISTGNPLNPSTGAEKLGFCPGDTLLVPFTASGPFASDNQFTAVLSDADGSFAAGTVISIAPLTGTVSDTILAVIPVSATAGLNYRIRVEASNPDSAGVINPDSISIFPLPAIPVITGDSSFCQGESVTLTSSSASGNAWTPGGQTTPAISINASGIYSVKVTDVNGCSSTSLPFNAVANAVPVAGDITFTGTLTRCAGDSIILTANPAGLDYLWIPGGASDTLQNLTVKASGTFSAVVVNSFGCKDTSASVSTTFNPLPEVPIVNIANDTVCQPNTLDFSTTAVATSYSWSGTGITPSPSGQSAQISLPGSYTVKVTITDANNCSNTSAEATGLLKQSPSAPSIVPVGSSLTRCADDTLVLAPSPFSAGNSYNWSPAGLVINSNYQITVPGTYTVSLSVDSNGCNTPAAASVTATLNALPQPVITTSEEDNRVCQGESVTLSSNQDEGNLWIPGGQTTKEITLSTSAPFVVLQVTDANGCVNVTDSIRVIVDPLPTVVMLKDSAYSFNDDVLLQAVNFPANVSNFEWFRGSTSLGSSGISPEFTSPAEATSAYSVIVTDVNGCQISDEILVRVSSEVFIPNSFSPNKDGKNDFFKVYGFGVKEIQFQVWDRFGKLVYESSNPEECVESGRDNNESAKGWNGEYEGKVLGQGSYIWTVKGKFNSGQDLKVVGGNLSGSVILLN